MDDSGRGLSQEGDEEEKGRRDQLETCHSGGCRVRKD